VDSAHHPSHPRGLPPWTLWAAIPVILALGFVTGMAIASYTNPAGSATREAPVAEEQVSVPPVQNAAPAVTVPAPPPDPSWRIVTSNNAANSPSNVISIPGLPGETPLEDGNIHSANPEPPPKFTGPAITIDDAKKALTSDFSSFAQGGAAFRVEYQKMTHTNGVALVGLIRVADYPAWEKAVREAPGELTKWLEDAARRVQPASSREGFHIAWSVVDVVDGWPGGFAKNELTLMDNGTYLVVRRLASTVDHTKTEISLRPLASLQESAANKQVTSSDPWATYGPVIRFDSTDLYRPIRTLGHLPMK